MTDQERAEEYVDTLLNKDDAEIDKFLDENLGDLQLNKRQAETILGIIKGVGICSFLAGLKEGKPKWHDLKESPKDLPKQIKLVIMYIVGNVYCNGWFNGDWWIVDNGNMIKIHREVVIAWCELPKFEE